MPQRVPDEVGQDDVDPARVEPGPQPRGNLGAYAVLPMPYRERLDDQLAQVDLVEVQHGRAGVEA